MANSSNIMDKLKGRRAEGHSLGFRDEPEEEEGNSDIELIEISSSPERGSSPMQTQQSEVNEPQYSHSLAEDKVAPTIRKWIAIIDQLQTPTPAPLSMEQAEPVRPAKKPKLQNVGEKDSGDNVEVSRSGTALETAEDAVPPVITPTKMIPDAHHRNLSLSKNYKSPIVRPVSPYPDERHSSSGTSGSAAKRPRKSTTDKPVMRSVGDTPKANRTSSLTLLQQTYSEQNDANGDPELCSLRRKIKIKVWASKMMSKGNGKGDKIADADIWIPVFKYLNYKSLVNVLCVSKLWNTMIITSEIWEELNFSNRKLTKAIMNGILKRQPKKLVLNRATVTRLAESMFPSLLDELHHLKHLSVQGIYWYKISQALTTSVCPPLESLDLGSVDNFRDEAVENLLNPSYIKPGIPSFLQNLKYLSLADTNVTDTSLKYLTEYTKLIEKLNLSGCNFITDVGIAYLSAEGSSGLEHLVHLNLRKCEELSDESLWHLLQFNKLVFLDVREIPRMTIAGLRMYVSHKDRETKYDKLLFLSDLLL